MGSLRPGRTRSQARWPSATPRACVHQGIGAELIAARWKLDRETLDAFSAQSHRAPRRPAAGGGFGRRDRPGPAARRPPAHRRRDGAAGHHRRGTGRAEAVLPHRGDGAAFPEINWLITPGNSSPLTDGASAALIMSEEKAAAARASPAGPVPRVRRRPARPAADADRPHPGHPQGARARGLSHRRHRRLRGQRGLRAGAAGLGRRARTPTRPSSTRAAARSRSATRSAASGTRLMATLLNHLEADRRPLRPADHVRGRRHGQRHHHRAALTGEWHRYAGSNRESGRRWSSTSCRTPSPTRPTSTPRSPRRSPRGASSPGSTS